MTKEGSPNRNEMITRKDLQNGKRNTGINKNRDDFIYYTYFW